MGGSSRSNAEGMYVLDAEGRVVPASSIEEWGRFFEEDGRRVLAQDSVAGDGPSERISISTVFLGLDHGYGACPGAPVLWETMIFGGPSDGYQERYASRGDAVAGHARARAEALRPPA